MTTADAKNQPVPGNPLRVVFVLALAAFFGVAVHEHLFSVNSQYYYTWKWKWIASTTICLYTLPWAIPFFLGQIIYLRWPSRIRLALAAIMISMFGIMVAGAVVQKDPPSFTRISDVVRSRWTTGYFTEAIRLRHEGMSVKQLLTRYPMLIEHFYLHPRTKPPGPILIEMGIIQLFGSGEKGALIAGLLIGIVATGSILATYQFILCLTQNRDAAFFGASFFALCPAPNLFFPQFDQCYPILTACIAVFWALALVKNKRCYSIALGFAYALAAFITYLPGVLPIFLIGFALLQYFFNPDCGLPRIAKHLAISLATFAAVYLIFWAITGFNPISTLRACIHQVDVLWNILNNVYHLPSHTLPGTIPTDLYDFALGSGWISYVLVFFYFKSAAKNGLTRNGWIALICVAQFVLIALGGIIQTETARVWLFMLPMLMLPIGLELANWRPRQRMLVYAALLLLTALICQSMEFIGSTM